MLVELAIRLALEGSPVDHGGPIEFEYVEVSEDVIGAQCIADSSGERVCFRLEAVNPQSKEIVEAVYQFGAANSILGSAVWAMSADYSERAAPVMDAVYGWLNSWRACNSLPAGCHQYFEWEFTPLPEEIRLHNERLVREAEGR